MDFPAEAKLILLQALCSTGIFDFRKASLATDHPWAVLLDGSLGLKVLVIGFVIWRRQRSIRQRQIRDYDASKRA